MLSEEETHRLRKLVHDLNNALAPVAMAGELLRPLVTEARGARLVDTLCTSAQHGTELVRQIQLLTQEASRPATPGVPGGPAAAGPLKGGPGPGAHGSPR
jgi:hypothetical protein